MPSTNVLRRTIINPHARQHTHGHFSHVRSHLHSHEARVEQSFDSAPIARAIVAARDSKDDGSDHMINLLLIILGIAFFALILVFLLFLLRRSRRQKQAQNQQLAEKGDALPSYQDASKVSQKGHGLTIETKHNGRSSVFYIGRDGQPMLQNPNSPPHSPDNVPEIRITFPDEQDDQGRVQGGRVVVVRVGDNAAVGLEPLNEEQLPAYEKEAMGQFHSIDMDRIGGLKEKDSVIFQ